MAEVEFTCEFCGQELKNFKLRLIPARKMPKKSLKLYHNPTLQLQTSSTFTSNQSSYAKYFHGLSIPKNTLQIKCETCSIPTSISTAKTKYNPPKPSTPRSERRQKKVKTQDLDAGLIIPPSMRSSSIPHSPLDVRPTSRSSKSTLFTNQETPKSRQFDRRNGSPDPSNNPPPKITHRKQRKLAEDHRKSKRKEMNQLQKALFKSKAMNNSGSTSLGSFLDQQ